MKSYLLALFLIMTGASQASPTFPTYLEQMKKYKNIIGTTIIVHGGFYKGCHFLVNKLEPQELNEGTIFYGKSYDCPITSFNSNDEEL